MPRHPIPLCIYNLCYRLGILEGDYISTAPPIFKIAIWQCKCPMWDFYLMFMFSFCIAIG